ncbi:hypothetical protein CRG98_008009 [Punica granatum]|uniref:Uncharacterized protein n=1 Tax=Punica granatum TaxID=22663 RepID=A0A2I0KT02_PUNGR|nr:hypothetical protein CRG98_008009 [Punica granatum]
MADVGSPELARASTHALHLCAIDPLPIPPLSLRDSAPTPNSTELNRARAGRMSLFIVLAFICWLTMLEENDRSDGGYETGSDASEDETYEPGSKEYEEYVENEDDDEEFFAEAFQFVDKVASDAPFGEVHLKLEMVFPTLKLFKEAVKDYNIYLGRVVKVLKNPLADRKWVGKKLVDAMRSYPTITTKDATKFMAYNYQVQLVEMKLYRSLEITIEKQLESSEVTLTQASNTSSSLTSISCLNTASCSYPNSKYYTYLSANACSCPQIPRPTSRMGINKVYMESFKPSTKHPTRDASTGIHTDFVDEFSRSAVLAANA